MGATAGAATVSVVVPTIGRPQLAAVIAGVLADPATSELVVVADRERARVEGIVASAVRADPRLVVIDGDGDGPAAARQAGIERARGDVVLLLDDDVVPTRGLVAAHRAAHAARDHALVVGPMPVAPELRRNNAVAHLYANDYDAEWSAHLGAPEGVERDLWGGNVSVRRVDAVAVPQTGVLGTLRNREDQEWGLRAARAGLTGTIAPDALAVHWHDRKVAALLEAAADQVRVGRTLAEHYPELPPDADAGLGLPRPARALVDLADVRGVGGPVRRATIAAARRFGDGPPARWRLALLVVARAMVQRAA